jgi:putative transposase
MQQLIPQVESAKVLVGASAACRVLGVPNTTYYRRKRPLRVGKITPNQTCRVPGRGLTQDEQQKVISDLNSDRFKDMAPPQVYSTLLDEGVFHCSISTMYRLLRKRGEINERRKQRTHVPAQRPELLANGPNQVWSWDITKLKGPRRWTYFHLFVVIDVFSRFVVGWCISKKSNARIAEAMLQDAIIREKVEPGQLTIHADNGGEMTSITVAELLTDLGVVKSHSRPHTSNDNPFSESHFKTMKYRPEIPARFESVEQARSIFRRLFHWYNQVHRHSGLALLTPATVHAGKAQEVTRARAAVLSAAYSAHPERFVNKPPVPAAPPTEVWINAPSACSESSRDDSEQAEARLAAVGQQELPDTHASVHKRSSRQSRTQLSRDASGGCHAATA